MTRHTIHGQQYTLLAEIVRRIEELDAEWSGRQMPAQVKHEWNGLNETAEELRKRDARIQKLVRNGSSEAGATFSSGRKAVEVNDSLPARVREAREAGLEALDSKSGVLSNTAMSVGTGSAGGFGVPFELDPSILLTSSGALNPVRQIAREIVISTYQWKGVSSAGVTAGYFAEGRRRPTTARRWLSP